MSTTSTARHRAAGVCTMCGLPRARRGGARCLACRNRQREVKRHQYGYRPRPQNVQEWKEDPPLLFCCGTWHAITLVPFMAPCCARIYFSEEPPDAART